MTSPNVIQKKWLTLISLLENILCSDKLKRFLYFNPYSMNLYIFTKNIKKVVRCGLHLARG